MRRAPQDGQKPRRLALGNGSSVSKAGEAECIVTGYMRFEADDIEKIKALLEGNPTYENGREVEILEMVKS